MAVSLDENKILLCGGEDINDNLYSDCFLLDTENKNLYRGLNLILGSCFKGQGCVNKGKVFAIDFRNDRDKNVHEIQIYDIDNNKWKIN